MTAVAEWLLVAFIYVSITVAIVIAVGGMITWLIAYAMYVHLRQLVCDATVHLLAALFYVRSQYDAWRTSGDDDADHT